MGVTLLVLKWQVYVQKAERKHWKNTIARTTYVTEIINHRTFTQIHTPTVVQEGGGGWMEPLPGVFDTLQYFETFLPLVKSLWSS